MTQKTILASLIQSEQDARAFGFAWPNAQMIVDCVLSECQEILSAMEQGESAARIQEEIGDLLHAAISLCAFAGFDVEQTLERANTKFSKRMYALKQLSRARGLESLDGKSIEYMLNLWKEAKVLAD